MGNIIKIQKRLDDETESIRSKYKLPNLAGIIVRDNGNTSIHTVQGVRDSSKSNIASNKATKEDYFNVGSISKPITGLLIARLIKKGILTWDTKIKDVFPEFTFKLFRDRCGINELFLDTKVYELMAHSCGMNGYYYFTEDNGSTAIRDTDPIRYFHPAIDDKRKKEWKNIPSLVYLRYLYTILCMKEKKFQYNSAKNLGYQNKANSGYGSTSTICAAMAEKKTGKSWETITTELLSELQLQMIYGNFPNGMQMHHYDDSSGKYIPSSWQNTDMAPYNYKFMTGGIHCTVAGMAQYIKLNLRAVNTSQLFDVVQYQAPVTAAAKGGLFLGGGANNEPLNHNGATGSSLANMHVYSHSGYGFSVMTNCGGGPTGSNSEAAVNELFSALQKIHKEWESI